MVAQVSTTKVRKAQPQAILLDRTFIQRNGVTLYTFQSNTNANKKYFITADATGKPDTTTHQDCKGFAFTGCCEHMKVVLGWKATDAAEVEIAECTAAVKTAEEIIKWPATCQYCGGNHASSNCPF